MAQKNYLVGEEIEIGYQAPNAESGLIGVVAEIYLPSGDKDSSYPDVSLIERGSSGTYVGKFTPDQQGEWEAVRHKADGDGQTTTMFSVGGHNVHTVGEKANALGGQLNDVEAAVTGMDGQLDTIEEKLDKIDTPPMAF